MLGLELLDEGVLEQERFLLGLGHEKVELHALLLEEAQQVATITTAAHVGGNPFLQVLGFAHIEDLAFPILEEIDPGRMRQSGCCLLDMRMHENTLSRYSWYS